MLLSEYILLIALRDTYLSIMCGVYKEYHWTGCMTTCYSLKPGRVDTVQPHHVTSRPEVSYKPMMMHIRI